MMHSDAEQPPLAAVETVRRSRLGWWWAIAGICLLIAVGLFIWAQRRVGPTITVQFPQGHGLKPGDQLRYRGIDVGEVEEVRLSDGEEGVDASIQLEANAAHIAREGSLFWIERPQIGLGRIRGLETVVGAKYVSVLPGPAEGTAQYRFQGEAFPLAAESGRLTKLAVRFQHGNGLTAGDPVRHRGIKVGEVVEVHLSDDLDTVEVGVRLESFAASLARAGSRFWIERPRLSFAEVRGLETVVGGRYLAVLPGPRDAKRQTLFDGLERPPIAPSSGIELVLESDERYGVQAGAPVTYRGMQVGSIVGVGLASDARRVETRIEVAAAYRALVREGTRFWSTGGIGINVGLTGVELNAQTLQTIAAGGVAFATPEEPGPLVSSGHRFVLAKRAEASWLAWEPRLPVGPGGRPDGAELPAPQPMRLHWSIKQLGWQRRQERRGLALRLANDRWLAPPQLLEPPAEALPGSVRIEVAGERIEFNPEALRSLGDAATYPVADRELDLPAWPLNAIRALDTPEDCLLVTGNSTAVIPLPAHRLEEKEGVWSLEPSFTIAPEWRGASVVATSDWSLVGILEIDRGTARIIQVSRDKQ